MTVAVIIEISVSLAMLCFAYGYMYRRTKLDRYREDLFTLRDEMFDYVHENGLSYSHPAYTTMRTALNGAIRFAPYLNLPSFLLLGIYVTRQPAAKSITETLGSLPTDHRCYFASVRDRYWDRLIAYVFKEGICGWTFNTIRKGLHWSMWATVAKWEDPLTQEMVMVGRSVSPVGRTLFRHRPAA